MKTKKGLKISQDLKNIFIFGGIFLLVVCVFIISLVFSNLEKTILEKKPNKLNNLSSFESNEYKTDGIKFFYPRGTQIEKIDNIINIDNWNISFFEKKNYKSFDVWFETSLREKCISKKLENEDKNLNYELYFIDDINCKNIGLYLVGKTKIGKINFGPNPNSNFEEIIATMEF